MLDKVTLGLFNLIKSTRECKMNTRLAVLYNRSAPNIDAAIDRTLADYKIAAHRAAKTVRENARYDGWGNPTWDNSIEIVDDTHTPLAAMRLSGKTEYDAMIEGLPIYPPVMYVLKAMENARDELRADGNRWMTPVEAEREFGLGKGTVRQYIHKNRETLQKHNLIHKPDGRTVFIKRGLVINRWGRK
jgi:hypothetical protein